MTQASLNELGRLELGRPDSEKHHIDLEEDTFKHTH